ncbi:hypothetical protein [Rheinheimera mangrovi]|uniref:hypothetical protein n=1 Tax=Rheinheimera mangrovi TaxID=2498451 RepID=UPI000F8F315E|nr:hypothetical protein [Rheinheimera mangrovi]
MFIAKDLQGKLDFSTTGGYNFGLGSSSININSGGAITESFKFSNPKTAIITFGSESVYSRDKIQQVFKNSIENVDIKRISSVPLVVSARLSPNICRNIGWSVDVIDKADRSIIASDLTIKSEYINQECKFSIDVEKFNLRGVSSIINIKPTHSIFERFTAKPMLIIHYT